MSQRKMLQRDHPPKPVGALQAKGAQVVVLVHGRPPSPDGEAPQSQAPLAKSAPQQG